MIELKQEESEHEIESPITKGGCPEDIEENLSITPRIEESEQLLIQEECPIELQTPELEPCGVIEEVEQLLTQEAFTLTLIQPSQPLKPQMAPQENLSPVFPIEPSPISHPPLTIFFGTLQIWPYDHFPQKIPLPKSDPMCEENDNPLSLRTNSKQPGEYDVYFHIHHCCSSSPTSREIKTQHDQEWKCLILVPLFEFWDERHVEVFLLIFKVPSLKGYSKKGAKSTINFAHSPTTHSQPKEDLNKLKEAKEVAKLCRKLMDMPIELASSSSMRSPIFMVTFEQAMEGP